MAAVEIDAEAFVLCLGLGILGAFLWRVRDCEGKVN